MNDKTNYEKSSECWICGKRFFGDDKNRKVRDHCNLTGRYRGAAHAYCNLRLSLRPDKTIIPVIFHNLRGYDSHLIMQVLGSTKEMLKCIPNNMDKYISFSIDQLRFIDTNRI